MIYEVYKCNLSRDREQLFLESKCAISLKLLVVKYGKIIEDDHRS